MREIDKDRLLEEYDFTHRMIAGTIEPYKDLEKERRYQAFLTKRSLKKVDDDAERKALVKKEAAANVKKFMARRKR